MLRGWHLSYPWLRADQNENKDKQHELWHFWDSCNCIIWEIFTHASCVNFAISEQQLASLRNIIPMKQVTLASVGYYPSYNTMPLCFCRILFFYMVLCLSGQSPLHSKMITYLLEVLSFTRPVRKLSFYIVCTSGKYHLWQGSIISLPGVLLSFHLLLHLMILFMQDRNAASAKPGSKGIVTSVSLNFVILLGPVGIMTGVWRNGLRVDTTSVACCPVKSLKQNSL